MRENRPYGSEGGASESWFLPLSNESWPFVTVKIKSARESYACANSAGDTYIMLV